MFLSPSSSLFWTLWQTFQSGMGSKPCKQTGLESAPAATSISNSRWIYVPFPLFTFYSFIVLAYFQSLNLLPCCYPFPASVFHLPSTDCLLYSGFLDAYVYLCISIKNHVPKHKNLLFVVCIQRMHPSASGNLPKQMMSQISFYSVFLEPYLQFFICLSFQSEQLQKAHWEPY